MYEKEHKKIVDILGNSNVSPASLSYKMLNESRYVNESLIQYIVNYITVMATRDPNNFPPYLENTRVWCHEMYQMLDKMGMVKKTRSRSALNHHVEN
jgi:hypothetical protein